jgi:NTP pyrophosphatase (non-canonical NTP hydrolase)
MGRLDRHYNEVIVTTWNAAGRCETSKDDWMNAALGLAGEAGEVVDQLKKFFYHAPKPPSETSQKFLLEMGDVMYYWNKLRVMQKLTLAEILDANKNKLFERYKVKTDVNLPR